jgi:hypothetical protein
MAWVDSYVFTEPLLDLRYQPDRAEDLAAELRNELDADHPLSGQSWSVIARAVPQDEVVVKTDTGVALVRLTWSGKREPAPWPTMHALGSGQELEDLIAFRY